MRGKRIISFIMSIVLVVSMIFAFDLTSEVYAADLSNNWKWPTYIKAIKNDWPCYSDGEYHGGTDFPVPLNTPVYSTCDGEIVSVQSLTYSYGKHIKVKAIVNGSVVYIRYCHLNSFSVSVGDKVYAGQLIGYSGSTGNSSGPHLHYEIRNANDYHGKPSSPSLNPKNYLPGTSYTYTMHPNPIPSYTPEGSSDTAVGGVGCVTVSGWAFDRDDVSQALNIHVYIGGDVSSGAPGYVITANKERTDVGSVYGTGNYHGFYDTIYTDVSGTQTLYFYAIGIGEGGNPFLGTKTVTIRKAPVGLVEDVKTGIRQIRFSGWAYDPEAPSDAIGVHVYVGGPVGSGAPGYSFVADGSRPDVGSAYGVGNNHGFFNTITTDLTGQQTLYFYALASGVDGYKCIGEKTVTIPESQSPIGHVDWAEGGTDCIKLGGWAYDPDNTGQTAAVHVYAGGPAGSGNILCEILANKKREDVGAGNNHGFSEEIKTNLTGTQKLYFYAIDTNGENHALFGTKTVTIKEGKSPIGILDSVQGGEGNIRVVGWAIDEDEVTEPVTIHVYVGGPAGSGLPCHEVYADDTRSDVKDERPGAGPKHGFLKTITTDRRGEQEVYVYAIDRGSSRNNVLLGHKTATIQEPVQEHTHQYEEETVRAATCAEDGEKKYACACGESYTNRIEKLPHTIVTEEAQPATCISSGRTEGQRCSVCGAVLKAQEIIEKTGHRHTETRYAREATCMAAGYTGDVFCTDCDMRIEEGTETERLSHTWDSGMTIKEPASTEEGICMFTCTECGSTRIKKIPAAGEEEGGDGTGHAHRYVEEITKSPTCIREGEKKYICSCGAFYTEALEKLGHDWDNGVTTKEPTEQEEGIKVYTCARCESTRETILPKKGGSEPHVHQYEAETVQFATCTKNGVKRYECVCGDSYTEPIASLGHDWDGGAVTKEPTEQEEGLKTYTCTRCDSTRETIMPKTGEEEPDDPDTHVHQYVEEIVKAATCIRDGEKKYVCACRDSYTEKTDRLGHDWDDGIVEEEATDTDDGLMLYTCRRCESTRETVIPKTGEDAPHEHSYEEADRKAPTCTEEGEVWYICVCGDAYEESIPAAGHSWDGGVITKQATAEADGERTFTCTVCGDEKKETIAKTDQGNQEEPEEEPLNEGDIVYDELHKAEYEVVWIKGKEAGVEYSEPLNRKDSSITIPDKIETEEGIECKVVAISAEAFKNNKKIRKVSIGKNVTSIGSRAFSGCSSLSGITIGKNVISIGNNAFSGCTKLRKLTLPGNVTKIGANVFYNCKKLQVITIKSKKLALGGLSKKAFKGIPEKAAVKVPKGKAKLYRKLLRRKGLSAKVKVS